MNTEQANKFADHWIASWNSHDLDKNLSHCTDDFEMSSPVIIESMGEPSGTLKGTLKGKPEGKPKGKQIIRVYWAKALEKYPQ